jgi:hypothetical protein
VPSGGEPDAAGVNRRQERSDRVGVDALRPCDGCPASALPAPRVGSLAGVVGLVLRGRDSAAGGVQPGVVVPVDSFQGDQLDLGKVLPGAFAVDLVGLVKADGGFGQRVVVAIGDQADRRVDAGLDEPAGEAKLVY